LASCGRSPPQGVRLEVASYTHRKPNNMLCYQRVSLPLGRTFCSTVESAYIHLVSTLGRLSLCDCIGGCLGCLISALDINMPAYHLCFLARILSGRQFRGAAGRCAGNLGIFCAGFCAHTGYEDLVTEPDSKTYIILRRKSLYMCWCWRNESGGQFACHGPHLF
jgi:hypothetical protein